MEGRQFSGIGGRGAIHLSGPEIRKINKMRSNIDAAIGSACKHLIIGSVIFDHTKGGAVFIVGLIIDIASVYVIKINAVRDEDGGLAGIDVYVDKGVILVYVQIVGVSVACDSRLIAVAVIDRGGGIGCRIIPVDAAVFIAVIIEILSVRAAGEHIGVGKPGALLSVDPDLVEGGSVFRVVMEVVDIVADERGIETRIIVEDRCPAAVPADTAKGVFTV